MLVVAATHKPQKVCPKDLNKTSSHGVKSFGHLSTAFLSLLAVRGPGPGLWWRHGPLGSGPLWRLGRRLDALGRGLLGGRLSPGGRLALGRRLLLGAGRGLPGWGPRPGGRLGPGRGPEVGGEKGVSFGGRSQDGQWDWVAPPLTSSLGSSSRQPSWTLWLDSASGGRRTKEEGSKSCQHKEYWRPTTTRASRRTPHHGNSPLAPRRRPRPRPLAPCSPSRSASWASRRSQRFGS